MTEDAPPRRPEERAGPIVREWLVFLLICLLVGAAFVVARVAKDGPQVLTVSPHAR